MELEFYRIAAREHFYDFGRSQVSPVWPEEGKEAYHTEWDNLHNSLTKEGIDI